MCKSEQQLKFLLKCVQCSYKCVLLVNEIIPFLITLVSDVLMGGSHVSVKAVQQWRNKVTFRTGIAMNLVVVLLVLGQIFCPGTGVFALITLVLFTGARVFAPGVLLQPFQSFGYVAAFITGEFARHRCIQNASYIRAK